MLAEKLSLLLAGAGASVGVLLAHEHLTHAPSEHNVRRVGLLGLPVVQMRVRMAHCFHLLNGRESRAEKGGQHVPEERVAALEVHPVDGCMRRVEANEYEYEEEVEE